MKAILPYDRELTEIIAETGKRVVREMMAKIDDYDALSVVNVTSTPSKSDNTSR